MAGKKRPPLTWDGSKPLKMRWALYFKGNVVPDVVRYDLEQGDFWHKMPNGLNQHRRGPFLVKRFD